MARNDQEWDYPPRQRRYRTYNVLDAVPEGEGWSSPATVRAVNVYWRLVKTAVRVVLGAVCGLVIIGLIWLVVEIVKA